MHQKKSLSCLAEDQAEKQGESQRSPTFSLQLGKLPPIYLGHSSQKQITTICSKGFQVRKDFANPDMKINNLKSDNQSLSPRKLNPDNLNKYIHKIPKLNFNPYQNAYNTTSPYEQQNHKKNAQSAIINPLHNLNSNEKLKLSQSGFMKDLVSKIETNYKNAQNSGDITTRGISSLRSRIIKVSSQSSKSQKESYSLNNQQQISQRVVQKPLVNSKAKQLFSSNVLDQLMDFKVPIIPPSKHSKKAAGIVKAFAANTHNGLIRNYNEDRVSIILNILKPVGKQLDVNENWPNCSFFGIYDGHGGCKCAEFLKEHLHTLIIQSPEFPQNPCTAIAHACKTAEQQYQKKCSITFDKSGSCATFALFVDNWCYFGNVGDSRIIVIKNGKQNEICEQITVDHKPDDENEYTRIHEAGGYVYQTKSQILIDGVSIFGPKRVFPGRLSVSRSFGDFEAKLPEYDGIPGVVVADPDVNQFEVKDNLQYMLLGCDGIFDKLTNQQILQIISDERENSKNIHQFCGKAASGVLKWAMTKKSMDNVTVIIIGFSGLKSKLNQLQNEEIIACKKILFLN